LMNEIKAERGGKVSKIMVENGMPVEFDQPLIEIVPVSEGA
jgi:biotin carboxyl carrier protein